MLAALSDGAADPSRQVVIFDLRLPIAAMAVLVGAMLGLAGAGMQTILGNPLADPFTLGVSAAASVGASLAIAFGWALIPGAGPLLVTANAFAFALCASLVLFALTKLRGVSAETMILVGIALLFTSNALLALIQYRSNETQLQQIVFWMMGSLGRASPTDRDLPPARWRRAAGDAGPRLGDDGLAPRRGAGGGDRHPRQPAAARNPRPRLAARGDRGRLRRRHRLRRARRPAHRAARRRRGPALLPARAALASAILFSLASTLSKAITPGSSIRSG